MWKAFSIPYIAIRGWKAFQACYLKILSFQIGYSDLFRSKWAYLITSESPRPKLHNTRLLIKGKVGDIYCTRTLKIKNKTHIELFFFMRRSVNTLYQKHTRIESLQLSGLFMNIIWPFIELRWSTFGLVYFSWLLNHVIYLKLKKYCCFTQDHFEWKELSFCEFAQLVKKEFFFSDWDKSRDSTVNWGRLEHM